MIQIALCILNARVRNGKDFPLGNNDGRRIFDWYFSGKGEHRNPLLHPYPGRTSIR